MIDTTSLDALLADRYEYLHAGLINYRVAWPEMWSLTNTFEDSRSVYALLKAKDVSAPYRADFPFLTRAENQSLTHHVDLRVVQAWPRPTVTIGGMGSGPARVIGEDRPARKVDVALKKVGFAQVWWSDDDDMPIGLIWEAILDIDCPPLVAFLWDACERLLEEQDVRHCFTTHRDPDYATDAYGRLLEARGYQFMDRADVAGTGVAGRVLCAMKML